PSGKHYIWASAVDVKGNEIRSNEIDIDIKTAKPADPIKDGGSEVGKTQQFSLHLNTGSNAVNNHDGLSFEGDQKYSSYYSSSSTMSNVSASKDILFQSERSAKNLRYSIPVPNGKYTVKTYHNELWFGKSGPSSKAGRRVFDISLEGKLVKKSFDIFVASGNKQTVLVFEKVEVKDGILNLDLAASENNATISGVSVVGEVVVAKPTIDLAYTNSGAVLEQGGSLTLKANVVSEGAKIQKVNFYYGLKLLATVTGSPYQTVWKNIPSGKHYIWA